VQGSSSEGLAPQPPLGASPLAPEGVVQAGLEPGEESYDRIVPCLIPGYSSLARLAVALLATSPLGSSTGAEVLVAGCGSGTELLEARAQRPDWQLTGLDPAPAMLDLARRRLGPAAAIHWHQGTVEELDGTARFDGALAVLVLQSLADDGSKLAFLSAMARLLKPGAQVVLVDLMQAERSPLQDQLQLARRGFQRASGMPILDPALQAGTVTGQTVAALTEGLHPIGLSRLTALVAAAGFLDPAPVFQALDVEGFLLQRCR
jgi:tRNA (cmo5U34)-methyltransferase